MEKALDKPLGALAIAFFPNHTLIQQRPKFYYLFQLL